MLGSPAFHPTAGARFSKVPKLYGLFLGVTIPFVSQERREFKSSNFTVISLFSYLSKTSGWQFYKWLFGPKKFSGLSRNGSLSPILLPLRATGVIVNLPGPGCSKAD